MQNKEASILNAVPIAPKKFHGVHDEYAKLERRNKIAHNFIKEEILVY